MGPVDYENLAAETAEWLDIKITWGQGLYTVMGVDLEPHEMVVIGEAIRGVKSSPKKTYKLRVKGVFMETLRNL